ncbi:MAG: KamA family radical SAM protein [Acidobacteria bacterium]|nr:KamA family radical SAM protein [Acidobacteriota bacterium]MBI3656608.1 KamA family radical SAM protein [Acidobacteriota bacterium]
MDTWKRDLQQSIKRGEDFLAKSFDVDAQEINAVAKEYPVRITPHWQKLMKEKGDPIWLQVVPEVKELDEASGVDDPLHEDIDSPVPGITHRYPDRVLFLVTSVCAVYCRFCTRKRLVGRSADISDKTIEMGLKYIRETPRVRDVLLSGGDPLMLSDAKLEYIISSLRAIPHVEVIRIGTRIPVFLPSRITDDLCAMLKKYHPFYMNLHFNHPDEITEEVKAACGKLADAGIPLGAQTVLLKGINDNVEIMKKLMHKLLTIRVRPYYLYQADMTKGTAHFRTDPSVGLKIIKGLRGHTTGFAVPQYIIDAPGGGGKIPILPDSVVEWGEKEILLRNFEGGIYHYPRPEPDGVDGDRQKPTPQFVEMDLR